MYLLPSSQNTLKKKICRLLQCNPMRPLTDSSAETFSVKETGQYVQSTERKKEISGYFSVIKTIIESQLTPCPAFTQHLFPELSSSPCPSPPSLTRHHLPGSQAPGFLSLPALPPSLPRQGPPGRASRGSWLVAAPADVISIVTSWRKLPRPPREAGCLATRTHRMSLLQSP